MRISFALVIACLVVSALMIIARELGGWAAYWCVLGGWVVGIIYKSVDD